MNDLITMTRGVRMRTLAPAALLALFLPLAACDLEVSNPNAPSEDEVLTTPEGIVALAVGMQDQFASDVEELIQGPALVSDEWGTGSRSLICYRVLLTGEDVVDDCGTVEEPWATAYFTIRSANSLIGNAQNVGLDAGLATGIVALAKLYKAMSLGMIAQQYEQLPVVPGGPLVPREEVFDSVLSLLESARAELAGADLSLLDSRVLAGGIDLPNTIDAMLARYYLFDGRYSQAIEAASRVDLEARSLLRFAGEDANPIWSLSVGLQYVFPLLSFVRQAEEGDRRPAYWVQLSEEPFAGNPDSLLLPLAQYDERNDPFPVYLPDEMRLIQAEGYAREGNLARARELINEVRTQCTTGPAPLPCLPALPPERLDTLEEVLGQIAYERAYELYLQGLRWEDIRRLGEFIGDRASIAFLPVPRQECQNNPNFEC